jgi:hypothetical protein
VGNRHELVAHPTQDAFQILEQGLLLGQRGLFLFQHIFDQFDGELGLRGQGNLLPYAEDPGEPPNQSPR